MQLFKVKARSVSSKTEKYKPLVIPFPSTLGYGSKNWHKTGSSSEKKKKDAHETFM